MLKPFCFQDPHAEGAANMIRGMASYISETTDVPTYAKNSQRTGKFLFS